MERSKEQATSMKLWSIPLPQSIPMMNPIVLCEDIVLCGWEQSWNDCIALCIRCDWRASGFRRCLIDDLIAGETTRAKKNNSKPSTVRAVQKNKKARSQSGILLTSRAKKSAECLLDTAPLRFGSQWHLPFTERGIHLRFIQQWCNSLRMSQIKFGEYIYHDILLIRSYYSRWVKY